MKIEDKFLKLRNKLKHLNKQYYNSKPSIDDIFDFIYEIMNDTNPTSFPI